MTDDRRMTAFGPVLSRRSLFQGAGLGLAALALPPAAARAATPSANQLVFAYKGPAGYDASAVPGLDGGSLFVVDTYGKGASAGTSVSCVSAPGGSGSVQWTYPFLDLGGPAIPGAFMTPLAAGGAVFLATSSRVIALDAASGTQRWAKDYPVAAVEGCPFTPYDGDIAFLTSDGVVVALAPDTGDEQWTQPLGEIEPPISADLPFGPPLVIAEGVCAVWGGRLYLFQTAEGTDPSAHPVPPAIIPRLVSGLGEIYYVTKSASDGNATLVALDTSSWTPAWTVSAATSGVGFSVPAVSGGMLYYGTSTGEFNAIALGPEDPDDQTRNTVWTATMDTADLTQDPIVISEGYAYVAGQTSTGANVYTVPLAPSTQDSQHVAASVNAGFKSAAIVGVDSSVCYYSKTDKSSGIKIQGVNLQGLYAQFLAESQLMAGHYAAASTATADGSAPPTPSSPQFRTQVLCVHPDKTPRAHSSVKIWASETVDITVGGDTHTVGPDKHAWVRTDGAGEFSVTTDATNVSAPALHMWAPFMGADESMIVYPDQDTLSSLSSISGSDLLGMVDFAGTPSLTGYDATSAEQLATTVKNTIGDTGKSLESAQAAMLGALRGSRRPGGTPSPDYFAFPGSTTNLVYQPTAGSAARPYSQNSAAWYADFDGTAISYHDGDGLLDLIPEATSDKGNDFDKFWHDVVRGGHRIKRIVWTAEKDLKHVAKQIHDDAGNLYNVIVDTVEKAAIVVAGIFRTVMDDVDKAIQALCQLFDWQAIVDTAGDIKTTLLTTMHSMTTAVSADVTAFTDWLTQNRGSSAAQAITDTQNTRASGTANYGNPQAFYGRNGAKSYCSSRWAGEKASKGASDATLDETAGTELASHVDSFGTHIKKIIADVEPILGDQVKTLDHELTSAFHTIEKLVSDPSQYADLALADLLKVMVDLAELLFDAAVLVADVIVQGLILLVEDLVGILNAPLDIPVLSDVYSAATKGDTLRILDVVCLLIAIPTHIVSTAASAGEAPGGEDAWTRTQGAYVFAGLVFAGMDVAVDLTDSKKLLANKPVLGLWASSAILAAGLSAALEWDEYASAPLWVAMQFAQVIPIVLTALPIALKPKDSPRDEATSFQYIGAVVQGFYALFGCIISGFAYSEDADGFSGADTLTGNVFTFAPPLFTFAPLVNAAAGSVVLAVVDGIGDLGAVATTVAGWYTD